jgi:hypothetical protein
VKYKMADVCACPQFIFSKIIRWGDETIREHVANPVFIATSLEAGVQRNGVLFLIEGRDCSGPIYPYNQCILGFVPLG